MYTILFFITSLVLLAVCIALAALLLESREQARAALDRWRDALAGRWRLLQSERRLQETQARLETALQGVEPVVNRVIMEEHERILQVINSKNHHQLAHKFADLLRFLESKGFPISDDIRRTLFAQMERAHQRAKRAEEEKARQAEIKAQMREEARVQQEAARAIREAEQEAALKRKALEEAPRILGDSHAETIERLRRELAEAQAKAERARSMAQLTKAGHVYVISNLGSFGADVFKISLTRRLDPQARIDELSDAAVPFGFDVHAMIYAEDAPALAAKLHQALARHRVNKVNLRKEFFRVDLATILRLVEEHHGVVEYKADAEALEYYETLQLEREMRGEQPSLSQIEAGS